jgi:hypothetical protein
MALERIGRNNTTPEFTSLLLTFLPTIEYQHQILIDGDADDRATVVADWGGVRLFERRLLFNRNFDFAGWCQSI